MVMNSYLGFTDADYLLGRVQLPPAVSSKQQKTYVYGGDVAVNTGSSQRLDLQMDADSDFLVEGVEIMSSLLTAEASDLLTCQISDTTFSQPWSNVAVPIRDLAGKGNQVHELKYPNMVRPTATISLNINNNSGTNCQVYVALHGRKFYGLTDADRALLKRRMWYQYVMQVPALAASSTGTQVNMQIFNESDFLLAQMLSWTAWKSILAATAGAVSAEIKCNFRDTSSDRNFYSTQMALRLVVGAYMSINQAGGSYTNGGEGQFRFKKPLWIRRNGTIQGNFDNLATGASAAFPVIFEGARVFDAGNNG